MSKSRVSPSRQAFEALVKEVDASTVARAALLIACEACPELDVEAALATLDHMGRRFSERRAQRPPAACDCPLRCAIESLNDVLFKEFGLRGDEDDYYNPANSFLNDVLTRRRGIPISLSIIYMHVGRYGGLDVRGVSMPGHFIVRVVTGSKRYLVDPFNRGQILTDEDCKRRVRATAGRPTRWLKRYLDECSTRDILCRMLNNLKRVYLTSTDFRAALWVQDLLLILRPDEVEQYRDRGLMYAQLQRYGDARRDLIAYLRLWPGRAPDADAIEEDLERLRRLHHMLN